MFDSSAHARLTLHKDTHLVLIAINLPALSLLSAVSECFVVDKLYTNHMLMKASGIITYISNK